MPARQRPPSSSSSNQAINSATKSFPSTLYTLPILGRTRNRDSDWSILFTSVVTYNSRVQFEADQKWLPITENSSTTTIHPCWLTNSTYRRRGPWTRPFWRTSASLASSMRPSRCRPSRIRSRSACKSRLKTRCVRIFNWRTRIFNVSAQVPI